MNLVAVNVSAVPLALRTGAGAESLSAVSAPPPQEAVINMLQHRPNARRSDATWWFHSKEASAAP